MIFVSMILVSMIFDSMIFESVILEYRGRASLSINIIKSTGNIESPFLRASRSLPAVLSGRIGVCLTATARLAVRDLLGR